MLYSGISLAASVPSPHSIIYALQYSGLSSAAWVPSPHSIIYALQYLGHSSAQPGSSIELLYYHELVVEKYKVFKVLISFPVF
jgi:hypothetical protein